MDIKDILLPAREAGRWLAVSPVTLRQWARTGKIKAVRTPGGRFRYPLSEIRKIRGDSEERKPRRAILYARVSSADQRHDLEEQVSFLVQKAREMDLEVIGSFQDIASGLNESRRGFMKVIEVAIKGEADLILVTYQDRLTRFGFKILQRLLAGHGVEVRPLLNTLDKDAKQELIEDLMSIITSFAGRVYGFRSHKIKRAKEVLKP